MTSEGGEERHKETKYIHPPIGESYFTVAEGRSQNSKGHDGRLLEKETKLELLGRNDGCYDTMARR